MTNAITVATSLVSALGSNWELMPNSFSNDNYQAFRNIGTGAEFYASTQKSDGKVRVGVQLPNSWKQGGSFPTVRDSRGEVVQRPEAIAMNPNKAPAKLAMDFYNRLEVEGTDFFLKSKQALEAETNAAQNRLDNRKKIAKALGAEWTPYFAEHNITTKVKNIHVSANVTTGDNVELTLSYLTQEQAEKVLALLG